MPACCSQWGRQALLFLEAWHYWVPAVPQYDMIWLNSTLWWKKTTSQPLLPSPTRVPEDGMGSNLLKGKTSGVKCLVPSTDGCAHFREKKEFLVSYWHLSFNWTQGHLPGMEQGFLTMCLQKSPWMLHQESREDSLTLKEEKDRSWCSLLGPDYIHQIASIGPQWESQMFSGIKWVEAEENGKGNKLGYQQYRLMFSLLSNQLLYVDETGCSTWCHGAVG